MKKIFFNGFVSVLLTMQISCVDGLKVGDAFLEKAPSVDVDKDVVFNDANYARAFLWNAYTTLYYGRPLNWSVKGNRMYMSDVDALTDHFTSGLTWSGVNSLYYSGQFNSTSDYSSSIYSYSNGEDQWTGIRKAWLFIENIGQTPNIDDSEKERLKGEAKMIIACHYADMFRNYGGLPLVTKAFSPNDDFKLPRATARETMNFITDLCDQAYDVLPWALQSGEQEQWAGRFTGAAALGLKIRVLLFGASPLFNDDEPYYPDASSAQSITEQHVWFGSKDVSLWDDVVDACELFITRNQQEGNPWKLVQNANPRQAYQDAYYKRANGELLIDTRVRATVSWYWDAECYYLQAYGSYGGMTPTLEYVDLFSYADGTPFDSSFWDKQNKDHYIAEDPFANRDPRLYENCLVNNAEFGMDHVAELWIGGREGPTNEIASDGAAFTGFALYKYILDKEHMAGKQDQWPYLRLPEIYLSYAEALNEVGRTGDAYQYINYVRMRVGLPALSQSFTQKEMREEILDERAREFGAEEVHYYDMIRWKREEDFRKSLHGLRIRRGDNNTYSYEKFSIKKRYIQDGEDGTIFFTPKWYLCPFPFIEMNKGYLTQNPGW